jgi:hypothetical protein
MMRCPGAVVQAADHWGLDELRQLEVTLLRLHRHRHQRAQSLLGDAKRWREREHRKPFETLQLPFV